MFHKIGVALAPQEAGTAVGHGVEAGPEARPVVHLVEMGQLVLDDVVGKFAGQEHEPERKVDVALRRAAAPARTDVLDGDAVEIAETIGLGQRSCAGGQAADGRFAQAARHHAAQPGVVARVVEAERGRQHDDAAVGLTAQKSRLAAALRQAEVQLVGLDAEVQVEAGEHDDGRA